MTKRKKIQVPPTIIVPKGIKTTQLAEVGHYQQQSNAFNTAHWEEDL